MASKERKRKKEDSIQSKSLGNFHNLELLCRVDDRQKKTLERIIKQKPDLARSLNIYADGVKYYIARHQQREKLLATKELSPLHEVQEALPPLPLLTQRRNQRQREANHPRMLSESIERKNRQASGINPNNYTPFANRTKVYIPALAAPRIYRDVPKLKFNYFLGQGNNAELVKQIFAKRDQWWAQVPSTFPYKHFTWQQTYAGMDFQRLTPTDGFYSRVMFNFFEFHKTLTTKTGLANSLLFYLASVEKTFNIVPLLFVFNFKQAEWNKDVQMFVDYFHTNNPLQAASSKTSLDFDFYMSNIAPSKPNMQALPNFKMQDTLLSSTQYLWLLKPADWNRGEGVHVFSTLEELETLIKQYYYGKGSYECREFVIQKYIERPLLIEGRKFDIRCWALVTQDMQFYLFKEAYIRTSGSAFSLENKDKFIHLTNNAVQKNATTYGQFEDGNQLSLQMFQQYLDQQEPKHNFREESWSAIRQYVKLTMFSTRMNKRGRKYSMQLFGYDFMIDQSFKTWLIEINANPCIEESSSILKVLIPRMLDDAFRLTVDKVFTPDVEFHGRFPVTGYKDDENLWELLGTC